MERQKMAPVIGRCMALMARGSASTRRAMLRNVGALLGASVAALGADPTSLNAKRRKKSKKSKKNQKPLKLSDWKGLWSTRLSNGVTGRMRINYETNPVHISGTYVNSVGSGIIRCDKDVTGTELICSYDQDDGETGGFLIDLTDKNHWQGSYLIDGGGSGTWSGARV